MRCAWAAEWAARVATDRPHRYAKRLASHLGRRSRPTWDEDSGEGGPLFQNGGKGSRRARHDAVQADRLTGGMPQIEHPTWASACLSSTP